MADQTSIDPYKELNIAYNSDDDTLTRLPIPLLSTYQSSLLNQPIFTKDFPLNTTHKTWVRLYKPINPIPNTKLPLILYFHGGGFILCSAYDTLFHDFCTYMAIELPAVVLSVGYRLAPENRLPAAYEDGVEAITWVRIQALDINGENLLKDMIDFSKCYLMGASAGGNLAYHAGLRTLSLDLQPMIIKGVIMNQPFFGGLPRTASELRLMNCKLFPLASSDLMWELALPKGSDRDHEYCNPMVEGSYKETIELLGKCFVNVRGGDILMDRQMEFVKMLEGKGVSVVTWFEEEGYHGMDLFVPHKTRDLLALLKEYVFSSGVGE